MLDDDQLEAVADAWIEIKERFNTSMIFSDALRIYLNNNAQYVLQWELIKAANRNYEKRRLQSGYSYGCRYMALNIRSAVHCLGGMRLCR